MPENCPHCGILLPIADAYCFSCGKPLDEPPSEGSKQAETRIGESSQSGRVLLLRVAGFGALIAGVIALLLGRSTIDTVITIFAGLMCLAVSMDKELFRRKVKRK